MEMTDFLSLIKKKRGTIASLVFIFLILASILTIIQPIKYGSSAQVLVIQNFANADPYQASKSTEYLSNILAKVVYSNSFFENVLSSGYFVDKNYFGKTVKDQMKAWSKTVSAKAINDSGIISLAVYHTDRAQAESIAQAIIYTLQTKHGLYHGNGSNVSIKIIDEPITSNYPVKPNLILNLGLALVLGLLFSLVYIYLLPEEKYSFRLIPKSTKKPVEPIRQFAMPAPDFEAAESDVQEKEIEYDNDDLDIHEEIARQGNMKNIFGRHDFND
ncbi:hypothetical protein COS21_01145 [bacterium (Candidatus Gribaldobacteria) CG02_land_8_20_14_3_00_41_15]|uniref:Polysaccharide chain length determinant N-terminal domain-containing protein n=1 Tax=bacterium (Candidatus Gribaldobacteria) CG02_land_8_20_14_3_00_41_15 TaxID=2014270 RepID=A0A2M7DED0_9BACT|nr:MAG: hypothetical protein COS21_01145 [bacterium (Candidatus Gribaldobacteria) CG02_land_8_20_14_3_00_41_15]